MVMKPSTWRKLVNLTHFWRNPGKTIEEPCTRNYRLPYRIMVGTHHKTGSSWMRNLFTAIGKAHSLRCFIGEQKDLPRCYDIFFQDHSRFDFKYSTGAYRGLHLIRDPRDIIISGAFYHQNSKESWLHKPMPILGGQTYQEALNRRETMADKILFEMEYAGKHTLGEMLSWNYANPHFFEAKYEEFIADVDLRVFRGIFAFLGFPDTEMDGLLEIAYANSLFSGQVNDPSHVRSGQPQQWRDHFDEIHRRRFLELFGDALVRLGYEKDDAWM